MVTRGWFVGLGELNHSSTPVRHLELEMPMRRRRRTSTTAVMIAVVMLAAAVALAGCSNEATSPETMRVPADAARLAEDRVLQGNLVTFRFYSGLAQRERVVVRTDEEWTRVWERITHRVSPPVPRPAVDFSQEMVVVVAMGGRPTGGYAIAVEGVFEAEGRLYAAVLEKSPGAACILTQALTQPIDVVRIPRRDGIVSFVERAETVDCR